jgi:hypothetical protein
MARLPASSPGAVLERTEGLFGRNLAHQVVVVPVALGFRGLLDLEQIEIAHDAAVLADAAVLGHEVVDGRLVHLLQHRLGRVRARRLDGVQVVHGGAVVAGLDHGRHAAGAFEITLGPLPRLVVQVPVEGFHQVQALRVFQPHAAHVHDAHEEGGHALLAAHDAELERLLDAVDGVAAAVGQADHLGLGGLRLQQERGEVRAGDRVAHAAYDLATLSLDHRHGVALQRMAEGVIGSDEVPALAAVFHDAVGHAGGIGIGVVGPVHAVGRAGLARQVGGACAGEDHHALHLAGQVLHRQCDRGVGHVQDQVHLVILVPAARGRHADVDLVLVVGRDHFDGLAQHGAAEILDGHLHGFHAKLAGQVGHHAGLVAQHADLHDVIGYLGLGGYGQGAQHAGGQAVLQTGLHGYVSSGASFFARRPVPDGRAGAAYSSVWPA